MADTFIDQCIAGNAVLEDIDLHISLWRKSNTPMPLHSYLGMSWEEFDGWMQHTIDLEDVIASKRKNKRRRKG